MDYSRDILALDDAELERFVLRWLQVMTNPKYHSTQRFAGAGDMGRDVVGFLTKARHEGRGTITNVSSSAAGTSAWRPRFWTWVRFSTSVTRKNSLSRNNSHLSRPGGWPE